jgi:hypothetical protein
MRGVGVGTYRIGVPAINDKKERNAIRKHSKAKNSGRYIFDSHEAGSTGCLDRVLTPTRTRHPRRDASIASWLVRGPFDKAPRLRSDSHEARLAIGKSLTRTTPGRITRPNLFTYSETKARAFNTATCYFLPPWPQL